MPEVTAPSTDGLSAAEVRELLEELRAVYAVRNGEYGDARDLYNGEHWDNDNLVAGANQYTLVANYLRPVVDGAVKDLFARMPGIQVFPRGTDERARRIAEGCEGALYRAWEVNEAPKVFRRAAFNAVLLRRGVLHYWWDPAERQFRFRSVAPDNFYPLYDGEDIVECIMVSRRLTRQLKRQYPRLASQITSDKDERGMYVADGVSRTDGTTTDALLDGGQARDVRRSLSGYTTVVDWYDKDGHWVRLMGDAVWTQNLGYGTGRVPFVEIRNNEPGDEVEPKSEVDDIAELNQYLDQLLSQQADIIKKYANPTVIDQGSGQDPQTIKRTIQQSGVLPVRKDGNVRFLNWEGPQPAIGEQYERIRGAIDDLSGRPRASYGETVTNQSGVMTNMALSPTVAATEDRATRFGFALMQLHTDALKIMEKFMAGEEVSYQGYRPRNRFGAMEYFESVIRGSEIAGWYRNAIKWPSMIRTDDPVFVQNIIAQVTSDPPLLPVYDAVEALGHDDAEALLDRISAQLEDPRFHPDRLKNAVDLVSGLQGAELPAEFDGLPTGAPGMEGMSVAAESAGSPNRDSLSEYA